MNDKILLVDDSALARRSLRAILEPAGYDVIDSGDGMQALEKYYLERPAVVLLDLVMKDMNGFDVLGKLREMDPNARVIVVSADIQHSSHELAEAAGASGFIHKPVDPASVVKLVAEVLAVRT